MDAMKLLTQMLGNNATGGGLMESVLKGALGGGSSSSATSQSQGGLGDMLGSLLGGGRGGGLMKSLIAAGGASLISSMLGGSDDNEPQALAGGSPAETDQEDAELLIRAMCNAAKSDGQIDEAEQDKIIGKLGAEVDESEAAFVRKELSAPLDVVGFARSVPPEMGANVYAISLMTIRVDTPQEAQYLRDLAAALQLDRETIGGIHQQLSLT